MNESYLHPIMTDGKALYLAYDHGLEHGPTDFNDQNIDPDYILKIGQEGKYNGVIFQKGIAEKYYPPYKDKLPLILKLNGKTALEEGEPYAPLLATVKEAKHLGAVAVGATVYIGSKHEGKMLEEFAQVVREAHENNMAAIGWMYPRGAKIKNEIDHKILAYSARVGLELGADMIKIKYSGDKESFAWVVKSAGKVKVVVAGGLKRDEDKFLKEVSDIMETGAVGLAVGRNVWQAKDPMEVTKKLKEIIWSNSASA